MQEPVQSSGERLSPGVFARNLRLLRKVRGVSQQMLADELGLKRNNIASYEAGIVEPKPERFLAIARFFHIDPLILLTEDLSEHPLEYLPHDQGLLREEAIAGQLDQFTAKTVDLQKVLEGFRAFYDLRKQQSSASSSGAQSLNNDLENLLEILNNLLDTNWEFIQSFHHR